MRSALHGHLAVRHHGAHADSPGISLREILPRAMAQVHGAASADDLRERLGAFNLIADPAPLRCVRGEGLRLLWTGPGQYLVVSQRHRDRELALSLSTALDGSGGVAVDVSHARSVLRVEGSASRELLAKGCPLDVDSMAPGDCAATLIGHFSVLLHRDDGDAFEIYVTRSFARSFLDWLLRSGAEFGVAVEAADQGR